MARTKIAAVSYLNTIPFIYGIEHSGVLSAELLLSPPSGCARVFIDGKADVALVPAAAVPAIPDAEIVTDYCIGATGPVRTVVMMCDCPLREIRRVHLDSHSLTSARLIKILADKLWKIAPQWVELTDYAKTDNPQPGDAFLLIGDKVFAAEGKFRYTFDLAEAWQKLTRMPFAFAVWIARKGVSREVTDALQHALTYGVEHTWEAIVEHGFDDRDYAYEYLTRNIDFVFDAQKYKALQKFWDTGLRVSLRANPG